MVSIQIKSVDWPNSVSQLSRELAKLYNVAVIEITHKVSSVKVLKNDSHFGEVWPAEASTNATKAPYWSQEGDKPRPLHNWVRTAFI